MALRITPKQTWSSRRTVALIGSLGTVTAISAVYLATAQAQTTYPDVTADYWAQPFIQQLSQANVLTGYPDGTFRPQQAIDRDEYAAVIRQAFDAEPVRSLPQASTFEDVPENYWASNAIEEAYETGFMDTTGSNEFEPRTEITRADAIVALVEGLGLTSDSGASTEAATPPAATEPVQPVQSRGKTPNRLAFPLASTVVMRVFAPPAQATPATPQAPTTAQTQTNAVSSNPEATLDLSQYYADADQIPSSAEDAVALATQAGLIVNYPDPNLLNPNQPITRGGTAALIYQALVYQNNLEPVSSTSSASGYVVSPEEAP